MNNKKYEKTEITCDSCQYIQSNMVTISVERFEELIRIETLYKEQNKTKGVDSDLNKYFTDIKLTAYNGDDLNASKSVCSSESTE